MPTHGKTGHTSTHKSHHTSTHTSSKMPLTRTPSTHHGTKDSRCSTKATVTPIEAPIVRTPSTKSTHGHTSTHRHSSTHRTSTKADTSMDHLTKTMSRLTHSTHRGDAEKEAADIYLMLEAARDRVDKTGAPKDMAHANMIKNSLDMEISKRGLSKSTIKDIASRSHRTSTHRPRKSHSTLLSGHASDSRALSRSPTGAGTLTTSPSRNRTNSYGSGTMVTSSPTRNTGSGALTRAPSRSISSSHHSSHHSSNSSSSSKAPVVINNINIHMDNSSYGSGCVVQGGGKSFYESSSGGGGYGRGSPDECADCGGRIKESEQWKFHDVDDGYVCGRCFFD